MMRLLGEHPEVWRRIGDDPTLVDRVVDESLRMSSPTQGIFRIARKDVVLGGVHIPKGAWLVLVYGSANRDENVFADGDEFVPERDRLKEHLAFGKGIHFCLGAALARLEARVALEELRARITSFELDPGNDFRYIPSFMLRGLTRLDLHIRHARL
jgi:cytochrome P450